VSDTTIQLSTRSRSKIFTFVGLNESGKTTLLEALHQFYPDLDMSAITGGLKIYDPHLDIPKHKVGNFSDSIEITAEIELEAEDIDAISTHLTQNHNIELVRESVPSSISRTLQRNFKSSNHIEDNRSWNLPLEGTPIKSKKKKIITIDGEAIKECRDIIQARIPRIAYFSTMLFDFPEKIYLSAPPDINEEKKKINIFYRSTIQDILDTEGSGYSIDEHIVKRMHDPSLHDIVGAVFSFTTLKEHARNAIEQILDRASETVSAIIFQKWNDIFQDKTTKRDIRIEHGIEDSGDPQKPRIFVRFVVKEGANKFSIASRSLGFRWFFCFLLFTQFRAARVGKAGTVFLFDEPASNLHSEAQSKLLTSFPAIATGKNILIYSTHSHYMIEPRWLEGAFVVENSKEDDLNDFEKPWKETNLQISAIPYRQFVGVNPTKLTYFQPILDKLQYRPSSMELYDNAIIFEGKSDFYFMKYFSKYIFNSDMNMFPGTGATNFDALVSLFLGWGRPFLIVLDGDKKGLDSRKYYREEYGLPESAIVTLDELFKDESIKKIESILTEEDKTIVYERFKVDVSRKSMFVQLFAELCASGEIVEFRPNTIDKVRISLKEMHSRFA
jgi:predicted ATP-dependent endonuclease of OLD family